MTQSINISDIESQLVARAEEIHTQLHDKRQQRKDLDAEIRVLVAEHKKAERLAKVVRKEIAKQTDADEAVASVTPPAFQSVG